jgi:trigger factor
MATELAIDKNYSDVIELLQKENIISRPAIEVQKISDTEFEVNFTSAMMPEIKLGKTSGFKAKPDFKKATKEEIEKELEKMAPHLKAAKEIEEERAVKEGDIANINFVGKKDGKAFDGGTAEGFDLKIGSGQFIPGFEEQVKGMKPGEEKDIELTFPDAYPQPDLAGQDVVFEVKLNSIKEEVELEGKEREERLKMMGFSSDEDMKSKIEFMINDQKEAKANDEFFNAVVKEIIEDKGTEVEIPEQLINDEVANQLKTFEQQLAKQGMTLDSYLEMIKTDRETFVEKNMKEGALDRIKHGLIYTQLIKDLKLEITDEMIEKELERIAEIQGVKAKDLKKNVNMDSFKNALTFQELVKLLQK